MITYGTLTRPPVKILIRGSRRVISSLSQGVPSDGTHCDGNLGAAIKAAMLQSGKQINARRVA